MSSTAAAELAVDWPACRARGLCHELLPDLVRLDEWGYPLFDPVVTTDRLPEVRRAVAACPTLALRLLAPR